MLHVYTTVNYYKLSTIPENHFFCMCMLVCRVNAYQRSSLETKQ